MIPSRDAGNDVAWPGILDVDGDGRGDIAAGAPTYSGGSGAVVALAARDSHGLGLVRGPRLGGPFGTSVASAGDLDGDGFGDLVAGAPGTQSAYLAFGGASGLDLTASVLPGLADGAAGTSVAGVGDLDGDGYADFVVGAPMAGEGEVRVYHGTSPRGATLVAMLAAPDAHGTFGAVVASACDTNGDGHPDLLVGAPGLGRVYLFVGDGTAFAAAPAAILARPPGASRAWASVGAVACAGDVDGDGLADVVVGDPGATSTAGEVQLYRGTPAGLSPAPTTILDPRGVGTGFGFSADRAGDVDADGFDDVVVGAWSVTGPGRAFVFGGSAAGILPTPIDTLLPPVSAAPFGVAVAGVGDATGDAAAEVAVAGGGIVTIFSRSMRTGTYMDSTITGLGDVLAP